MLREADNFHQRVMSLPKITFATSKAQLYILLAILLLNFPLFNKLFPAGSIKHNSSDKSGNDNVVVRCNAEHFGRFLKTAYNWKRENVLKIKSQNENSSQRCVQLCSGKRKLFAAVSRRQCLCHDDPMKMIQINSSGSPPTRARMQQHVQFYRIINPCSYQKASLKNIHTLGLGCFRQPATDDRHFESFYGVASIERCFDLCERKGHVLAVKGLRGRCQCGHFTTNFNLTHKIPGSECLSSPLASRVFRTWAEDTRCSKMSFVTRPRHRVSLVSVPGSGNTWLRYLVEKASGFFTGSMYEDKKIFNEGFLGEFGQSGCVLIKDHMWENQLSTFNASVLLIRDPYESLVSEFHHMETSDHLGVVEAEVLRKTFVIYNAMNIEYLSLLFADSNQMPLYVLYYEELLKDPIGEVKRLLEFPYLAEIRPNDLEDRLLCLSAHMEGFFKRKPHHLGFDPFTSSMKAEVNRNIARARLLLGKRGFRLPSYERS